MITRLRILLVGCLLIFLKVDATPEPLKERQPNWRTKTLASFPEGGIQKVLYYKLDVQKDRDIPVKVVTFFQDGKMESETDLIVLAKEDPLVKRFGTTVVPHGFSVTYWSNGIPSKVLAYDKGQLSGNYTVYDETSTVIEKGFYQEGLLSGIVERFYPDGTKAWLAHYKDGVLEGELTEWHTGGAIKAIQYYTRGLLNGDRQKPAARIYNENRTLIETQDFRLGRPYGIIEGGKSGFLPMTDKRMKSSKEIEIPRAEPLVEPSAEKVPDGEYRRYYPLKAGEQEGELEQIVNYKDGKFHGVQKTFYPNGQTKTLITYKNGVLHGQKAYWDNQGVLLEEAFYNNGDLEGRYYQQEIDGTEIISYYCQHRLHGLEQVFYSNKNGSENRIKAREATYVNGLLEDELALYNREGVKVASSLYHLGLREGISTIYSVDGRVLMTVEYHGDKKHGKAYQYFPNGMIQQENTFADDLEEGEEKAFFKNGEMSAVRPFKRGKLNGTVKEWNNEGKLVFEANYKDGKRHGRFFKYDQTKDIWIDQTYENDKLVTKK